MAQLQIFERNFINSIRSKATRESYRWYFSKYRKFVNEKIIHDDPKIIENQIIDFFLYLKQKGLSYNSLRPYLAAITHFYSMNDIVINSTKISKFISIDQRKKTKSNQGYTTEQIQQLLDVCDERTRAIILLYASSGIRLAALPSLRYGDLKPVKIKGGSIYEITVYEGYTEEYITFCTPECAKVINSYLDYRTRSGETLRADSPLIREQFNASNSFRVKYPKSIATPTISKIIEQKMTQAGIRRVDHVGSKEGPKMRKEISLIHGFRKFFNTALMNADVHPVIKELLMGHSVKLDDFYYDKGSKKSKEKLLDEYIKAIDSLTISEENRLRIKVESEKQKEDRVSVLEKQMQSMISTLSKMTEQGQVNAVAQTLYSSGILKEGNEGKV